MIALRKPGLGVSELELAEVPEPALISGHVILEVAAAGICGTDLHILNDEYRSAPPVTLGHEVAGKVHAVADDVVGWEIGQRIVSETYFSTCGLCAFCRSGRPNLCAERRSIGSFADGGFAPFVLVPASGLHALPHSLGFPEAALVEPLACVVRGLLELGSIRAGELALIAGPGAIGLLAAQVAKAAGARVCLVGTSGDGERLALARGLGADLTLELAGEGSEVVLAQLGDTPDLVIECSGAGAAAALLLACVKKGGRFIQMGLYGKPVTLDMDQVCYKELQLTGSFATTPSSWRRALVLAGSGAVSLRGLVGKTYPLAEWRAAFAAVMGRAPGKVLLVP